MTYTLILVVLLLDGTFSTDVVGEYKGMDECFKAREDVVEIIGRPVINYQVICIAKDTK